MSGDVLQTKLYIPTLRPSLVPRPHLIQKLNTGLDRKLTLISAPAGFGKTTLITEWIRHSQLSWLSLDEGDNDSNSFLAYVIAALQTVEASIGGSVLKLLHSPQPPPMETILTTLINEIARRHVVSGDKACPYTLVLDDYHYITAQPVHEVLTFLLDHSPPQFHLVIASRTDPPLPLPRLRIRGELTELRAADLHFTPDEIAAELYISINTVKVHAKNIYSKLGVNGRMHAQTAPNN